MERARAGRRRRTALAEHDLKGRKAVVPRSEIDRAVEALGISAMEFIRRACVHELEQGKKEKWAALRQAVMEILMEEGIVR